MRPEYDLSKMRSRRNACSANARIFIALVDGRYVGTLPAHNADDAVDRAAVRWADGDDERVDIALAGDH